MVVWVSSKSLFSFGEVCCFVQLIVLEKQSKKRDGGGREVVVIKYDGTGGSGWASTARARDSLCVTTIFRQPSNATRRENQSKQASMSPAQQAQASQPVNQAEQATNNNNRTRSKDETTSKFTVRITDGTSQCLLFFTSFHRHSRMLIGHPSNFHRKIALVTEGKRTITSSLRRSSFPQTCIFDVPCKMMSPPLMNEARPFSAFPNAEW